MHCEHIRNHILSKTVYNLYIVYLWYSFIGATHKQLIDGAKEASGGRVLGRFFGFYPPRQVNLVPWLAHWIRNRAVPVATMNMQRGVPEGEEIPDAWHHQLIFGVAANAVFMTNPLDLGMWSDIRGLQFQSWVKRSRYC